MLQGERLARPRLRLASGLHQLGWPQAHGQCPSAFPLCPGRGARAPAGAPASWLCRPLSCRCPLTGPGVLVAPECARPLPPTCTPSSSSLSGLLVSPTRSARCPVLAEDRAAASLPVVSSFSPAVSKPSHGALRRQHLDGIWLFRTGRRRPAASETKVAASEGRERAGG